MNNREPMQLIRIGGLYRLVTSRYLYNMDGRRLIRLNSLVVLLSHQQIMPNVWQVEVLFGELCGRLEFGAYPFDLRDPYMILAKESEKQTVELQKGKLYRLKVPRMVGWTETCLPKGSIFVLLGFEKRNGAMVPYYVVRFLFGELEGTFSYYRGWEAVLEPVEEPGEPWN